MIIPHHVYPQPHFIIPPFLRAKQSNDNTMRKRSLTLKSPFFIPNQKQKHGNGVVFSASRSLMFVSESCSCEGKWNFDNSFHRSPCFHGETYQHTPCEIYTKSQIIYKACGPLSSSHALSLPRTAIQNL